MSVVGVRKDVVMSTPPYNALKHQQKLASASRELMTEGRP
jgi:hypothetical protein